MPPPIPAVMKTMSESASAWLIFSESSSAARWPIDASPPAPSPRVILSPIRILCGASACRSAWASVLQAMNSTPIISARIIRLTALLPPPPTPMTRISAKFSELERNGIGLSSATLEGRFATGFDRVDPGGLPGAERVRRLARSIAPRAGQRVAAGAAGSYFDRFGGARMHRMIPSVPRGTMPAGL